MDWLADEPPMCSVPECRQTPGGLHHQTSKAQGDIVPSGPFLSWQAANMAAGLLSFHSSLGRTQALRLAGWQTNRLCAQQDTGPEPSRLADKLPMCSLVCFQWV